MTQPNKIFVGADIFDGTTLHKEFALALWNDGSAKIISANDLPTDCHKHHLHQGTITPGFVDLQVNGGGGVMLNDDQSIACLSQIATAHAKGGTTGLLPTLITDTPAHTKAAIAVVEQAINDKTSGILGLHLEGPHLSLARKGAHDAALIRPMEQEDLDLLLDTAERIANLMITVAPENVTLAQIRRMAEAGIVVSLGHTDADYFTCMEAFDAGARCVTHLYNAMSQLGNRTPGLVGATFSHDEIYAGLIADGIHVHPVAMQTALRAPKADKRLFLVTDAMAPVGSDMTEFTLNGRKIYRRGNQLTLENGTLAGADLTMPRAVRVLKRQAQQSLQQALACATAIPAQLLRDPGSQGRFTGSSQNLIYLNADLTTAKPINAL